MLEFGRLRAGAAACFGLALVACDNESSGELLPAQPDPVSTVRVATFNVSLYRDAPDALVADLAEPGSEQLTALKAIIGQVDPDILVLNEFDYDGDGAALAAFAEFLDLGYDHRLALPSNTGIRSGVDYDGDGQSDHPEGSREYGNDAFGYGIFPGQYAIALLSRHPIDEGAVRTFRELLWKDMPDNLLPTDYYSDAARDVFRLSSKTHADVPVEIGSETLHMVLAHPTPPGFDGEKDRNGRRNHDEIRLLLDYVTGTGDEWLSDDEGVPGGLSDGAAFVIAGDLNADPVDGAEVVGVERSAIAELLAHPRTVDPEPRSFGGTAATARQGDANEDQAGDPSLDTADFSDRTVGNLRVDYVIPSSNLKVVDAGVFWPDQDEPGYDLVGPGYPVVSSDHRMVWVDLVWPPAD